MKLKDSPSLDDYADGIPSTSTTEKSVRKRLVTISLWVLVILIVVLLGVNFMQGNSIARFIGTGTVSGYAFDENEQPIEVEILIFGTNVKGRSNETGYFSVANVPSGQRSIIVAYGEIASEIVTVVNAGENNDVGIVEVPTSLEIDY